MHWTNRSSIVPIWLCFAFVYLCACVVLFHFWNLHFTWTSMFFGHLVRLFRFHFPSTIKFHQKSKFGIQNWCKIVSVCNGIQKYPLFYAQCTSTLYTILCDVKIITIKLAIKNRKYLRSFYNLPTGKCTITGIDSLFSGEISHIKSLSD